MWKGGWENACHYALYLQDLFCLPNKVFKVLSNSSGNSSEYITYAICQNVRNSVSLHTVFFYSGHASTNNHRPQRQKNQQQQQGRFELLVIRSAGTVLGYLVLGPVAELLVLASIFFLNPVWEIEFKK